jgi:hypothetical protein
MREPPLKGLPNLAPPLARSFFFAQLGCHGAQDQHDGRAAGAQPWILALLALLLPRSVTLGAEERYEALPAAVTTPQVQNFAVGT